LTLDRISIELTNACAKACSFCYNHSQPEGATQWTVDELTAFVLDCAEHGVAAVSFGGGEPLQYPGLFDLLGRLEGRVFRSFTTNGLLLDGAMDRVVASAPNKVHVSIHFPQSRSEVDRVCSQVIELDRRGVTSGVNLLVARSQLTHATSASRILQDRGIGVDRIVFLPMRGGDTPTPQELAGVAGTSKFQSMTCLLGCGPSPRFASIGWDRNVAWCSYTVSKRPMKTLDYTGLTGAMRGLELRSC